MMNFSDILLKFTISGDQMGKSLVSQSQVCNILQYVHLCSCFWTTQIGGEFHDDRMNEMQEIKEAQFRLDTAGRVRLS